jgi:hypothetical protein
MMQTLLQSLQHKQLSNLGGTTYWSMFSATPVTSINSDREPSEGLS